MDNFYQRTLRAEVQRRVRRPSGEGIDREEDNEEEWDEDLGEEEEVEEEDEEEEDEEIEHSENYQSEEGEHGDSYEELDWVVAAQQRELRSGEWVDRRVKHSGGHDSKGKERGVNDDLHRLMDWSHLLQRSQVSRAEVNQLVMEYFVLCGCQEAAVEFSRESGSTDTIWNSNHGDGDNGDDRDVGERGAVGLMGQREETRRLLLQGDVLGCVRLLEDIPADKDSGTSGTLLDKDPDLRLDLYKQHFAELLLSGAANNSSDSSSTSQAILWAQQHILPLVLRDSALRPCLQSMMALMAFSSPENIDLVLTSSTLPAHLSFLRHALEGKRRSELAARVNRAILLSSGLPCDPELPVALRSVVHLQQQRCRARPCPPHISQLTKADAAPATLPMTPPS